MKIDILLETFIWISEEFEKLLYQLIIRAMELERQERVVTVTEEG